VVRTVFKIAEVVARRLVGSIPTRSRHFFASALYCVGLQGDGVFATPFATQNRWLGAADRFPLALPFRIFRQLCCLPVRLNLGYNPERSVANQCSMATIRFRYAPSAVVVGACESANACELCPV
jgi:hypothetical protein